MARLVVLPSVVLIFLSGCAGTTKANDLVTKKVTISVHDISTPLIVAHRGGPLKNPEESLESFHAAADAGFPMEMDIKALKDGTLVPSHDRTVDRTMKGATGSLANLSKDDWAQLEIRPVADGEPGTPTTWDELMETFGGKILMVPQIDETGALLDAFISSIKDRSLGQSVIVQSWSLKTSKKVAESGLHTLQLISEKNKIDPVEIAAAGIEYVGVPTSVDEAYVASLKSSGLDVWAYTANTIEEAEGQFAKGTVGVFTDDPWLLTGTVYK